MEYILAILFFGVILGVTFFFLSKEKKKLEEMVSKLSVEQKNQLASTSVNFVEGKNDEWIQDGMIGEMIEKSNKFAFKVLWHNKVIQNATYDKIQYGIASLPKEIVEKNNLKVGSMVKVHLAPAKSMGTLKIIL
jgi:23S rRNA A1618 N6-methylase RlmF